MEQQYQVTFSRQQISDYDITFIRDVMSRYLSVDYLSFNQAFQSSKVVFKKDISVDKAQLCLTELEAAGIDARVEKVSVDKQGRHQSLIQLPELAEVKRGENDIPTCESMLGGADVSRSPGYLLSPFMPNSANSIVVVLSYLIVGYQLVDWLL